MTPITELQGVGKAVAEKLKRLDIYHIEDLLFHLPDRYQDRTRIYSIASLRDDREALVEGNVVKAQVAYRGRRMLLVSIEDGTAELTLRFFHFSNAQQNSLRPGTRIRCFGMPRKVHRSNSRLEMIHPEYRFVGPHDKSRPATSYTPVYPTTEGISQFSLRKFTDAALRWLSRPKNGPEELLPADCMDAELPFSLQEAVHYVHRPPADSDIELLQNREHPMQRRLAFEEMLAQCLSLKRMRGETRRQSAWVLQPEGKLFARLQRSLPFELTQAQRRVIEVIRADIRKDTPMMRLVQGDVGSGKTLVAVAAMLEAVESNCQAAMMAPTEILAEQHYRNVQNWFGPFEVRVGILAGKQKTTERRSVLHRARNGEIDIIVGTHALFQEKVAFHRLALIVVDEQHRFGVHQRLALKQRGETGSLQPHQLIMTATPIPRSLAMTLYADLDYSVIDEMPPGRLPVKTIVLPDSRREELIGRIRETCIGGGQVYWVCPLIEKSDTLHYETAQATFELLRRVMPDVSVTLLHGRMSTEEKEQAIAQFKSKQTRVLVATTVIEVGVDIPNANLIVVENAERFGLAQLHQLRGRVGRGTEQAACALLYHPPLSSTARRRLDVMRRTCNGFEIAQEDMKMRGPGEILGTRQTGAMRFRIADLTRDANQLERVLKVSGEMLERYPDVCDKLIRRWLGDVGRYAEV